MATRTSNLLFLIPALLFSFSTQAQLTARGDDGREVILNDDGSWQYSSSDRYAQTSDGRRIRLKEDGSWEYDSDQASGSKEQFRNSAIDVSLQRVEIEEYREAATTTRKNPRISTKTSFYFSATVSALGQTLTPVLNKGEGVIAGFTVTDDHDNTYTIIDFSPEQASAIEPGASATFKLRVSGSPKWGPKTLQLTIDKQVFSSGQDIILTTPVAGIERVKGS